MNRLLAIALGVAFIATVLMAGCLGTMPNEINAPNMTIGGRAVQVIADNTDSQTDGSGGQTDGTGGQTDAAVEYRSDCAKNLTNENIIFFYSPYCPHCVKDYPIVENKSRTVPIYFAKGTDPNCTAISERYKSEYVPYFVCVLNSKNYTGEMDAQGLDNFISECK